MSDEADRVETARLVLRRWRPEDATPFATMNADPAVMEHIGEPLTREQSDAMLSRIERQFEEVGYGLWAVEVGWRLVPPAWGHGYATEAATAAVELAFGPLGLEELVSITTTDNLRSQAVMGRLGMQRSPELDFERERLPPGHPLRPAVVFRLDRATRVAR